MQVVFGNVITKVLHSVPLSQTSLGVGCLARLLGIFLKTKLLCWLCSQDIYKYD